MLKFFISISTDTKKMQQVEQFQTIVFVSKHLILDTKSTVLKSMAGLKKMMLTTTSKVYFGEHLNSFVRMPV